MDSLFNDAEKRFMLAEMIKLSQLDVGVLIDFVKAHEIQPNWLHMQLPGGRNMNQCLHAAEAMLNTPMPPPAILSPLKRKSLGDLDDYVSKRRALPSPGELSPRGLPLGPGMQPTLQPVNIQPRPNGYAPAPSTPAPPAVSATPYNPVSGRRRGRPPKSVQNTWQVSTYASIAPSPVATTAPQPHSPGMHTHPSYGASAQNPSDPKTKKKALPEIAPRPTQGMASSEPAVRSPAVPGTDYQNWREETSRREHYQVQATEPAGRDRLASGYPAILPRPRSPHPRAPSTDEVARPASTEPRRFRETPPASGPEQGRSERQTSAGESVRT